MPPRTTASIAEAANTEVQNEAANTEQLFIEQVQSHIEGFSADHVNDDGGCILTMTLAYCRSTYPKRLT